MSNQEWYGWHFLKKDKKLQFPPHTKVKVGQTLKYIGKKPIQLCERGFHASSRPIDALQYAPGPIICYVRLSGLRVDGSDKSVATERKVIWMADATVLLHHMSIWCAEQAIKNQLKLKNKVDPRSLAAIKAKKDWLAGKITNAELAAAWEAAQKAAWAVAQAAAGEAAWAAAWAAAGAVAWEAAQEAAGAAAGAAAWEAAQEAAQEAAWVAAGAAAQKAARAVQNRHMLKLLSKLKPNNRVAK